MSQEFLNKNFSRFRNDLLFYSAKFRVSYEDREEIVNDTILKALDHFNSDKGSFESYCRIILKNKIINFTKRNKDLYFLIALDDYEEILPVEEISFEEKEINQLSVKFLEKLKNELKNEELKLFNELCNACDTLNKINITEASRNIGIDPVKAWDTFRKIQRKANKLYKKMKEKGEDVFFVPVVKEEYISYLRYKFEDSAEVLPIMFQKVAYTDKGYEKFIAGLNKDQIDKINLIYGIFS